MPSATAATIATGVAYTITSAPASTTVGATQGWQVSPNGTSSWSDITLNAVHNVVVAQNRPATQITRYFRAWNLNRAGVRQYSAASIGFTGTGPLAPVAPAPNPPVITPLDKLARNYVQWTVAPAATGATPTGYQAGTSSTAGFADITDANAGFTGIQHQVAVTPASPATPVTRWFRAYTVDAANNRQYSTAVSSTSTPRIGALAAPTGLATASITTQQARIRHLPVTGAQAYQYRFISQELARTVSLSTRAWSTTYTGTLTPQLSGSPNTTYQVQVRAVEFGYGGVVGTVSPASATYTYSLPITPINPPVNLVLVNIRDTRMFADWQQPLGTGIIGYNVRVNNGTPFRVTSTSATIGSGSPAGNSALTPATAYTVEVQTVTRAGTSTWVSVMATTLEAAPANFNLILARPQQMTGTWTPVAGKQYETRIRNISYANQPWSSWEDSTTPHVFDNLNSNIRYWAQVRVKTTANNALHSEDVQLTEDRTRRIYTYSGSNNFIASEFAAATSFTNYAVSGATPAVTTVNIVSSTIGATRWIAIPASFGLLAAITQSTGIKIPEDDFVPRGGGIAAEFGDFEFVSTEASRDGVQYSMYRTSTPDSLPYSSQTRYIIPYLAPHIFGGVQPDILVTLGLSVLTTLPLLLVPIAGQISFFRSFSVGSYVINIVSGNLGTAVFVSQAQGAATTIVVGGITYAAIT